MEDNWVLVFNTTDEVACERAKVVLKKEKIKLKGLGRQD